ncbi:unnamed protein product [Darwinula stevensoni]|uniref:F-actin monooxygenase n=1 Tax=Darwinula stevensoni TaxID=69355 RepID=A0A7R8XH47_9CRUS|nr:unnamed protein product [Darwinula stevensoni]CAG0890093.1 unnamed protein product [Darwinula stevensoni]
MVLVEQGNVPQEDLATAAALYDQFSAAQTFKSILGTFRHLCHVLRIRPTHFPQFYPILKSKLKSWKAQALWSKFEKRASHRCYGKGKSCANLRVLVIGCGPCGLRTAIEAQLLGAKVVVVEKRDRFSRNNVIHLWPFVIHDLRALGAKKFYGKFCAGAIDHISIRQLQCILLKVALLLGVEVHENVTFEDLVEPSDQSVESHGWMARLSPHDHPAAQYEFDVLVGADGKRNTLQGFKRKEFRGRLAIAITANFINRHTEAEARVEEISGVAFIFNQKFFKDLNEATGIDLENIVYYKDETHYFVMTAKKHSLICKGVILHDYPDTAKLLAPENVDREALLDYAQEAANFSTEYQLPSLDFALNHYGQPDIAMFDFTSMFAAENACRMVDRKGHKLLMCLVGDSLLEPFWPTGSGCARGFLSSFDACWMMRSWALGNTTPLHVLAEREAIYRLLAQTTPENLHKDFNSYTLEPQTRYPNLVTGSVLPFQVRGLFDTDAPDSVDLMAPLVSVTPTVEAPRKKRRRDSMVHPDTLVLWLQKQVAPFFQLSLDEQEFLSSLKNGLVLCAILHRYRPDLIDFQKFQPENVARNNQIAFDICEKELGIPPVMTGLEMEQCEVPDKLTMMSYLSQVYECFRGEIPQVPRDLQGMEMCLEESAEGVSQTHVTPSPVSKRPSPGQRLSLLNKISRINTRKRYSLELEKKEAVSAGRRARKRRIHDQSRHSEQSGHSGGKKSSHRHHDYSQQYQKSMQLLQNYFKDVHEIRVTSPEDPLPEMEDFTLFLYRQTTSKFDDKVRSLEQKLFDPDRETRQARLIAFSRKEAQAAGSLSGKVQHLEEKLQDQILGPKKPKDMIRAIGKIERGDWNVKMLEQKIQDQKIGAKRSHREEKVPKWNKDTFDDKLQKAKKKEAQEEGEPYPKYQEIDQKLRLLEKKLREGSTMEVGQRGANKVSAMAQQLTSKLKEEKVPEKVPLQRSNSKPLIFTSKSSASETCHFCVKRVYLMERLSAEGRFFHRGCFRCEYCSTTLRLGNYAYDRDDGENGKFLCMQHYIYGFASGASRHKYQQKAEEIAAVSKENLPPPPEDSMDVGATPEKAAVSPRYLEGDEMQRVLTPERIEFENSLELVSEEEVLSEMDEDEWTDHNFGPAMATEDEASDLSSDSDSDDEYEESLEEPMPLALDADETRKLAERWKRRHTNEGLNEEDASMSTEEEGEESSYEECEDPREERIRHVGIQEPVIKVQCRLNGDLGHKTKTKEKKEEVAKKRQSPVQTREKTRDIDPARKKKLLHANVQDVRTASTENLAAKRSLELKKNYMLLGSASVDNVSVQINKAVQAPNGDRFQDFLSRISERQKLLNPAPEPSPAMQAFLRSSTTLGLRNQALASLKSGAHVIANGSLPHDSPSPSAKVTPPGLPPSVQTVSAHPTSSSQKDAQKEDIYFAQAVIVNGDESAEDEEIGEGREKKVTHVEEVQGDLVKDVEPISGQPISTVELQGKPSDGAITTPLPTSDHEELPGDEVLDGQPSHDGSQHNNMTPHSPKPISEEPENVTEVKQVLPSKEEPDKIPEVVFKQPHPIPHHAAFNGNYKDNLELQPANASMIFGDITMTNEDSIDDEFDKLLASDTTKDLDQLSAHFSDVAAQSTGKDVTCDPFLSIEGGLISLSGPESLPIEMDDAEWAIDNDLVSMEDDFNVEGKIDPNFNMQRSAAIQEVPEDLSDDSRKAPLLNLDDIAFMDSGSPLSMTPEHKLAEVPVCDEIIEEFEDLSAEFVVEDQVEAINEELILKASDESSTTTSGPDAVGQVSDFSSEPLCIPDSPGTSPSHSYQYSGEGPGSTSETASSSGITEVTPTSQEEAVQIPCAVSHEVICDEVKKETPFHEEINITPDHKALLNSSLDEAKDSFYTPEGDVVSCEDDDELDLNNTDIHWFSKQSPFGCIRDSINIRKSSLRKLSMQSDEDRSSSSETPDSEKQKKMLKKFEKDREKQGNLVREMVMSKIKSPERKDRRGSRTSLSSGNRGNSVSPFNESLERRASTGNVFAEANELSTPRKTSAPLGKELEDFYTPMTSMKPRTNLVRPLSIAIPPCKDHASPVDSPTRKILPETPLTNPNMFRNSPNLFSSPDLASSLQSGKTVMFRHGRDRSMMRSDLGMGSGNVLDRLHKSASLSDNEDNEKVDERYEQLTGIKRKISESAWKLQPLKELQEDRKSKMEMIESMSVFTGQTNPNRSVSCPNSPSRGEQAVASPPQDEKNAGSEKKKKSKDRERRRSIIQMVQGLFSRSGEKSKEKVKSRSPSPPPPVASDQSPKLKERASPFRLKAKEKHKHEKKAKSRSKSPPAELNQSVQSLSLEDSASSGKDTSVTLAMHPEEEPNATDLSGNVSRRHEKLIKRAARQAELKRLRMAQEIQRQLEELEVKQKEVEERGVNVEKALRGEGTSTDMKRDEAELMQEWFALVHERTRLGRYEQELLVRAKELELEDRHSRLQQELRDRLAVDDMNKSKEDIEEEGQILAEMLEIVEQRDSLIAMMEEDRQRYPMNLDPETQSWLRRNSLFTPRPPPFQAVTPLTSPPTSDLMPYLSTLLSLFLVLLWLLASWLLHPFME